VSAVPAEPSRPLRPGGGGRRSVTADLTPYHTPLSAAPGAAWHDPLRMATASSGEGSSVWHLGVGERVKRTELHERFGGRGQGGIGPSSRTPNVFVFSEAASGEPHGYIDGWREDGCFHYTGEGQKGDQLMQSGNAAILRHGVDGRALRLFDGARGTVTYKGQFELDPEEPYYTTDAIESGDSDSTRTVIVFRLRPLGRPAEPGVSVLDEVAQPGVAHVPVEQQWTEKAFVAPGRKEYEAERREQAVVLAFRDYLEAKGHSVDRLKIVPPGEAKPIFCDLIDNTTNTLYEAKGSVERGAIRMAVGQLLDYARFVEPQPKLVVLAPTRPRRDLMALLDAAGIGLVWRDGKQFIGGELE
jgi:hypothetical protein